MTYFSTSPILNPLSCSNGTEVAFHYAAAQGLIGIDDLDRHRDCAQCAGYVAYPAGTPELHALYVFQGLYGLIERLEDVDGACREHDGMEGVPFLRLELVIEVVGDVARDPGAREPYRQLHDLHYGEAAAGVRAVGEADVGNARQYARGDLGGGKERAARILCYLHLARELLVKLVGPLAEHDRVHVDGREVVGQLQLDHIRACDGRER